MQIYLCIILKPLWESSKNSSAWWVSNPKMVFQAGVKMWFDNFPKKKKKFNSVVETVKILHWCWQEKPANCATYYHHKADAPPLHLSPSIVTELTFFNINGNRRKLRSFLKNLKDYLGIWWLILWTNEEAYILKVITWSSITDQSCIN